MEQRRYTRIKIRSMDIKCKMHYATDVRLLNISFNGACIRLNRQLKIGNEYILHIESGTRTISVKGVVVWERMVKLQDNKQGGGKTATYEAGINFSDVVTDSGANLLDFIDRNIFLKQSRVRLRGLRVKVINPETSTVLSNHKTFSIIKLSPGGMLIETGQSVELEDRFMMEIMVPKMKMPVKFLGRVASCVKIPDSIPECYGVGIEFLKMSREDTSRLKKFIDSLQSL